MVGWIGLLGLLLSVVSFAGHDCPPTIAAENPNSALSVESYSQPYSRTLAMYRQIFGSHFSEVFDRLPPGAVWIDGGAGLGLATLQAANERHIHGFPVNPQDFWGRLLAIADSRQVDFDAGARGLSRIEGIDVVHFSRAGTALGFTELPRPAHVARWLRTLALRYQEVLADRYFHPTIGLVPDVFFRLPNAHFYTDLYGPFFYGARRASLVGAVYRQLEDGGTALFLVDDRVNDVVETPDGTTPLTTFLQEANPDHVHLYSSDRARHQSVLVVRKSPRPLVLPTYLEDQELTFAGGTVGFRYARGVRYRAPRLFR